MDRPHVWKGTKRLEVSFCDVTKGWCPNQYVSVHSFRTLEQAKEVKNGLFSCLGISGWQAGETDHCRKRRNTSAAVFYSSQPEIKSKRAGPEWEKKQKTCGLTGLLIARQQVAGVFFKSASQHLCHIMFCLFLHRSLVAAKKRGNELGNASSRSRSQITFTSAGVFLF